MDDKINGIINYINTEIGNVNYPKQADSLFEPIKYILSIGGKRIRPLLSILSVEMFGGKREDVIYPAIGLEIFHNFTLMHDDLMDKAVKRRGNDTVHIKWNDNTAILSGDAMQIMAYQYIAKTNSEKLPLILNLFSKTALEICEGQQFDMEFENRINVSEDEYLEMIKLKTAVLVGCALEFGAITANASKEDAELIYKFGEYIGLAFQLKDDLLDVYADTNVFGKNIGGDILNDKKTYLLINALRMAKPQEKEFMNKILLKEEVLDPKDKIEYFTRIYNESGAKEKCEKKIEYYYKLAFEAISKVSIDSVYKSVLIDYAKELIGRES